MDAETKHKPQAWSTLTDLFVADESYHPGCSCGWRSRESFRTIAEAEAWAKDVHVLGAS